MDCVIYELDTGRILQTMQVPDGEAEWQIVPGETGYVEGLGDSLTHYVLDGELVERVPPPISVSKATILADDLDEAAITGLPDPCVVSIDGVFHEIVGGTLTMTSPMPATYAIACHHWPYLDWETTVEAVPA